MSGLTVACCTGIIGNKGYGERKICPHCAADAGFEHIPKLFNHFLVCGEKRSDYLCINRT
jgi:hypothetical protein